jgi:tetratricopeptide (TPR) repeat protein
MSSMDKYELVERYEALGDEDEFATAKELFERDLADQADPLFFRQYGYLLECHGRRAIQRAIKQYERSMTLDPAADKVQYQWIGAMGSVGEADSVLARYRARVAAAPGDVRELRFLASAYVTARDYAAAADVIETGLELAPDDWKLIADRGQVKAARGDTEGALADWRRAHEIDPMDFSTVYASAFLLEEAGRLAAAADAWRQILVYAEAQGWELDAQWPRQEIRRLEGLIAARQSPDE